MNPRMIDDETLDELLLDIDGIDSQDFDDVMLDLFDLMHVA